MTNIKLYTYSTMYDTKLEMAWRNMEEQNCGLSPFLYFDYIKYIFRQTARLSLIYSPMIICVESSGGEILMIAPIKRNICNGTLKMLGDIQGCGLTDFLFSPHLSEEEIEKCIDLFMKKAGKKFKLKRIVEDSPINTYLAKCEKNIETSQSVCVKLKFTDDVDMHIKGLSASVRQNLRTAYNRIKRDQIEYELRIWMPENVIEPQVWEEIMKLYLKRLFGKYKRQKVGNLFYKLYKTILYTYFKHDTHSLHRLGNSFHAAIFIQGELACFMSGFSNHKNTRVVIPRLAINDDYKFYSPGYILICETMKWLVCHTSIREIDLSRGTERYKSDLGGEVYSTNSYALCTSLAQG